MTDPERRELPATDVSASAYSRRRFVAGATLAAFGPAVGRATAAVEADPFTLGVASGDPLPESVVLWTRLAPAPLERAGGMSDRAVTVEWTVAEDEGLEEVVTAGTAVARPERAHSVHVVPTDLEPGSEYYYRFRAGEYASPVGRTKTAPGADDEPESFRFAVASCQAWQDGFYTAYRDMAAADLDLVVHLGDYIYEYPIGPSGGARGRPVPEAVRTEPTTLDGYRRRYALYRTDPDLRAAHASAPWLVARDDHEVDNNYAAAVPQDPGRQPESAFLDRRAAAFRAHYEHMPLRPADRPDGPDQELYRRYEFGDLLAVDALDTRQYRSDQACGELVADCAERLDEDRTILGADQREWLLETLDDSGTTWEVLANQLPMASMDLDPTRDEAFRMDQWDGYAADRRTVLEAFEPVDNPVVVTGDVHSNWANDLRHEGETVGTEFVGTSISSAVGGPLAGPIGRLVAAENQNVHYFNEQRGYVRCRVTPEEWTTTYRVVEAVDRRGRPVRTDRRVVLPEGSPGVGP
jgi:alkaline phosphatase D